MLVAFASDPSNLDGAAKLVEAAGKGNLAFASFLVLVVAAVAWTFFGKGAQWLRIAAFLVIIACIVFVVFVLAVPTPKQAAKDPSKNPDPVSTPPQETKPANLVKQCTGEKTLTFTPKDPGVMQYTPRGDRVDLGDGGGGTRLEEWKFTWKAPAKVTSVHCAVQRNEHVIAENKYDSTAECVGSINGGADVMTMAVSWDGSCDQQ
jgi:hypothetical protein